MKYIFQFLIIAVISFVGELLSLLLPLPIPGSVYGLLLMLLLLSTGLLKLHQVEKAGDFLVQIMPMLFIGPTVGILSVLGVVADSLAAILVICAVTTIIVTAVTGLTAQAMLRGKEEEGHE